MIDGLWQALGFLTRIPVPARGHVDASTQARSLAWYPLVGALLGVVLGALAWSLSWTAASPLLAAAIVLAAWVALTGALHLDGLADSADAWVGGFGDRARTLAIMKDPRSGPVGVVAVVLVLLLKYAALASLPLATMHAWLLAPLLARMALTAAFVSTPYVRSGGLGAGLVAAPRMACVVALLAGMAVSLAFGLRGVLALAAALLVGWAWRRACLRRLGGITGDTAGALAEAVECAVLLALGLAG